MALTVVYFNEFIFNSLLFLRYSFLLIGRLLPLKFLYIDLLTQQILDIIGPFRICLNILAVLETQIHLKIVLTVFSLLAAVITHEHHLLL